MFWNIQVIQLLSVPCIGKLAFVYSFPERNIFAFSLLLIKLMHAAKVSIWVVIIFVVSE